MHKLPLGTYLYAVGGNLETSRKVGLKVEFLQYLSFIIMGSLCWLSSLVYLAKLSGYPPESAYINQLHVILSVFFGMAISRKNVINVLGSCIGVAFAGLLTNGLGLMGVSSYWIKLVEGSLVIIIIIGNSIGKKGVISYE
jgi:ribose transport system permease protein